MLKTIQTFQQNNEDKINLYLNHLLVVYMFLVPIAPNEYAVDFIFSLMFLLIAIRGNFLKYLKISLSHPITRASLLMMSVFYIWMYGNSDTFWAEHMVFKYNHYFMYPFFFFLFLDYRFFERLLTGLISGVMLSEILSYLMQFHIIPWGIIKEVHMPWAEDGVLNKIVFYRAWTNEPNPFLEHSLYSVLIATTASILLYRFLADKKIEISKYINLLFFTTVSFNLFFTGGRTGYILYFMLISYLIYFSIKTKLVTKKYIFTTISVPIIIAMTMYLNGGKFKERIDHSLNVIHKIKNNTYDNKSSLGTRYELQKAGLQLIKENPFFGVGTADQLSELRNNPDNKNNPIQGLLDVHNQYIDILMQFGIIGFLVYLNFIYTVIKFKPIDKNRNTIKNITLIAMLWSGFTEVFTYFYPVFFTALFVATTGNKKILKNDIKSPTSKEVVIYITIAILSYAYEQLQ